MCQILDPKYTLIYYQVVRVVGDGVIGENKENSFDKNMKKEEYISGTDNSWSALV